MGNGEHPVRSVPEIAGVEVPASVQGHDRPFRVLVSEPDAVSRRLICSLLRCESDMTLEWPTTGRIVSTIQEFAPDPRHPGPTHACNKADEQAGCDCGQRGPCRRDIRSHDGCGRRLDLQCAPAFSSYRPAEAGEPPSTSRIYSGQLLTKIRRLIGGR